MSMSKQDFIALADSIKDHNRSWNQQYGERKEPFTPAHLELLATFCKQQNSNFMRDRWLDYIAGKCGKNGGAIK